MKSLPYPSYKHPCGWGGAISARASDSKLRTNDSCDAIVIGAGYTGLAIAKRLAVLHPDDDIRVLDADYVGSGSPGRNSGFMLETVLSPQPIAKAKHLFLLYRKAHQDMLKQSRLFIDKVHCPGHVIKAAATARGQKTLQKMGRFLQASGQPWNSLNADQLRELTGSEYYRCGISLPGNRLVNPVQLINSLASHMAKNVTIHENSPATALFSRKKTWCVRTPDGTVKAPKVFLANNAFAKHLGYGYSRTVTIYTYAGLTPVLENSDWSAISRMGHWGLLPAHRLGATFRTTMDGRLLVRGMYAYEREGGQEVRDALLCSLRKRFPELEGAKQLEKWWGGTTSLTGNGAPLWGELKSGLFISVGCNGTGIVKGWLLGTELGNLASGQECVDVPSLFGKPSWIPPEPFRKIGFKAISEIEKGFAGNEQ